MAMVPLRLRASEVRVLKGNEINRGVEKTT
jgi:hypothetical protein